VDRNIEMDYCTIIDVMTRYKRLGCQTVTITGGGEPLLHKRINDVIGRLYDMGISMGMVTNGWNITRLSSENINKLTWVRISLGDSRKRELTTPTYWKKLHDVVDKGTRVDWSFSYVLTKQPYYKLIEKMLEFANLHKFTHIRMTSDIFIADQLSESMNLVRQWVKRNGIDDRIVIYQDRAGWDRGQKQCLISLLKPVVSADGNIYPCCGVQYALDPPTKDFATRLRMGTIRDIERIINEQKFFDGSVCVKCYYKHYNDLLSFLLSDVEHTGFV
jgi:MoaA/NifB/PqqE/SkfB family radical SAM enzyme